MKNFVKKGEVLTITATEAKTAGSLAKIGRFIGCYANDSVIGEKVGFVVEGVVTVTKETAAEVLEVGDEVYFYPTNRTVRLAAVGTGDYFCGIVTVGSANGDTTVRIKLERGFPVVHA